MLALLLHPRQWCTRLYPLQFNLSINDPVRGPTVYIFANTLPLLSLKSHETVARSIEIFLYFRYGICTPDLDP